MFEVQVLDIEGVNIALGKNAVQSSTFVSRSGQSFNADNAIDGDPNTFSHTTDRGGSWWEVDLEGLYSISSIDIKNRWCKYPSDPTGCLCKLSNATVSLLGENGALVASVSTKDTCDMLDVILDLPTSCIMHALSSSPVAASCLPMARKVKLHQTSGSPIQIFELEVFSSSTSNNIAVGKTATRSSTFVSSSGIKFEDSNSVDGNPSTFSHTTGSQSWLEVDLEESTFVNTITLQNRWCKAPNDPTGCLCKLTGATLILIDELGADVTSINIGDTCGQATLEFVFDPSTEFCLNPSVSFLTHYNTLNMLNAFYVLTSIDLSQKSLRGASPSKQSSRYQWQERVLAKAPTRC
jgi:hypothetical protein